jgi:hypothetical protein
MPDAGGGPAHAANQEEYYWQDKDNPDMVWTKFILDSEGPNKNNDYMPRTQFLASYVTAKYKPMDMEHVIQEDASMVYMNKKNPPVKNTIFGVMTNAALADYEGESADRQAIKAFDMSDDPDREERTRSHCRRVGRAVLLPLPANRRNIVQTSAGTMKVSMERWLKDWDFLVRDGADYRVIPRASNKVGNRRQVGTA